MGVRRPAALLLTIFSASATNPQMRCDVDQAKDGESLDCLSQVPAEALHLLQKSAKVLRSATLEHGQGTDAGNVSLAMQETADQTEAAVQSTAAADGQAAATVDVKTDTYSAGSKAAAEKLQPAEKEQEETAAIEEDEDEEDDESHDATEEDESDEEEKKEVSDTEEGGAHDQRESDTIAAEAAAEAAEDAANAAAEDTKASDVLETNTMTADTTIDDNAKASDVLETNTATAEATVDDKAGAVEKADAPKKPLPPPKALSGSVFALVAVLCIGATAAGYKQGPDTQAMLAPYICEFLGTFLLVMTVGCVVLTGSGIWNATAIAAILMVAIYAVGPVSGGHLNPAVTLALVLTGKEQSGRKAAMYMAVQLLGGIAAGCLYSNLFGRSIPLGPSAGFGWSDVMIVEVLYTAMLCFVVLNCAASKRNNPSSDPNQFFALAIGFVIIAGGYAGGPVSGGAFNPAVALGLDISSYSDGVPWGLAYTVYQCLGAALASLCFYLCRPEDFPQAPAAQSNLQTVVEDTSTPLRSKALSEFLGTFYLVFTVGMNLSMGSTATAWSAAAALMCMIYSLGDVSGANFNPAVTLSILLGGREKLPLMDGLVYMACQLFAGAVAGLLWCHFHMLGPNNNTSITLGPHGAFKWTQIAIAELTFTFVLAYTVLCVATTAGAGNGSTRFYFALAIGSCVTAGGFAIGSVSGGELNPAVSLGIASAGIMYPGPTPVPTPFGNFFFIALVEMLGGALASCVFRLTHVEEYRSKSEC